MALVHSLVDNTEIDQPSLKAFLHQRTRQWKYTDLSTNPTQCTELPEDYSSDCQAKDTAQGSKPLCWNEQHGSTGVMDSVTETLHRLTLSFKPSIIGDKPASTKSETDSSFEWKSSVLCPTFAGGKDSTGECVFTESEVQHAILDFFEEVAQNPRDYRNPVLTTYGNVPHPTAHAPFGLSADPTVQLDSDNQTASPMMTPEQMEVNEARAQLADMRIALGACPDNDQAFAKGRTRLIQKIEKQETTIKELQVKAISSGSQSAGEVEDLRQDWSPKIDGPQVPFAGTLVSSELLKAAGLGETASEELDKPEDGEKAFI